MRRKLEEQRIIRNICSKAPQSCFNCPLPDCINNSFAKVEETAFVNLAFDGTRHPKKYHKGGYNDEML